VVLNSALASNHGPEVTGVCTPRTTVVAALAGSTPTILAPIANATKTDSRVLISNPSLFGREPDSANPVSKILALGVQELCLSAHAFATMAGMSDAGNEPHPSRHLTRLPSVVPDAVLAIGVGAR
jgi:hypothetical protein